MRILWASHVRSITLTLLHPFACWSATTTWTLRTQSILFVWMLSQSQRATGSHVPAPPVARPAFFRVLLKNQNWNLWLHPKQSNVPSLRPTPWQEFVLHVWPLQVSPETETATGTRLWVQPAGQLGLHVLPEPAWVSSRCSGFFWPKAGQVKWWIKTARQCKCLSTPLKDSIFPRSAPPLD